jgi:phosphatidylserine/phosphatidylglycerophosphate/cardiolipin synthase-like enzyme
MGHEKLNRRGAGTVNVLRSVALLVFLLSGCASLPAYVPSPLVYAVADGADTPLGRLAVTSSPTDQPTLSGFRLLPEGETAFNARIALAARAQRSIDAQYYLIKGDDIGLQLLRELRDTAVRGVRVRLLVDDLYTSGEDDLLGGLAAYPNVDVRLFNPLPRALAAGLFCGGLYAHVGGLDGLGSGSGRQAAEPVGSGLGGVLELTTMVSSCVSRVLAAEVSAQGVG